MTEYLTQLQQRAEAAGATYVRLVDPAAMNVKQEVLDACAANACGRYGRCWTCPPHTGEVDALLQRLNTYTHGILVQNISPLEDSWDFEGMAEAAKHHSLMLSTLADEIQRNHPDLEALPLAAGGCGVCERCTCPDQPCRFPNKAISSVEGHGVDVKALVESVGLKYINGVNTVSYVGVVLLRPSNNG